MKQKKVLAVFLVMLLAMACSLFANGSSEQGAAKEIVLDFPTWQAEEGGFGEFWKEMVRQFEESHPNVRINLTQIPFSQFTDTLITRYSANDAPDITHIASRFFDQFASQGWFENLDPYFAKDNLMSDWTNLQSSMVYNGENQGLLVMSYGFVLYYNEKILEQAGVTVPTSVEELRNAVEKIEALGNPDLYPFGMTTQQHSNVFLEFCNFLVGEGTSMVKDGEYNLTSTEVVEAAKDYSYFASKSPKGVPSEMLRQLFVDGKVAMIIDGPWVAPMIATADEDIKPYLKLARPPFTIVPGTISNSLHIAKNLPEDRKQLVYEFYQQIASPENQVLYSELTQSPCGRLSASASISDPNMAFINDIGASAVNVMPDSANLMKNYSRFTDMVITYVLKMQEDGADVAAILSDMQADLEKNSLEP